MTYEIRFDHRSDSNGPTVLAMSTDLKGAKVMLAQEFSAHASAVHPSLINWETGKRAFTVLDAQGKFLFRVAIVKVS